MRLGFAFYALFYSRKRYAIWLTYPLASAVTITPWGQIRCLLLLELGRLRHMAHHSRIRWYNPRLNTFEWREVPESDEEALSLLEGSPYSSISTETYREWRNLGAPIAGALIRAGEAAKQD
jgi:hypothetical protein